MADRTGNPRLIHEAANLGEVECRLSDEETGYYQDERQRWNREDYGR